MNTGVIMVILTLLPGGDLSSSFVNIDTLDECEQRFGRIRPVLQSGNVALKEAGCFRSTAQFDYFDHDPPKDAPRYSLSVRFDGDLVTVRKHESPAHCRKALERQPPPGAGQRHYCTTSTQDMTGNGG